MSDKIVVINVEGPQFRYEFDHAWDEHGVYETNHSGTLEHAKFWWDAAARNGDEPGPILKINRETNEVVEVIE